MNRKKAEQWILLDLSGELGSRKMRKLEKQLAADPDLQAFRQDVQQLTRLPTQAPGQPPDSRNTAARLERELDSFSALPREAVAPPVQSWQPALAAALTAMLIVGLALLAVNRPDDRATPGTQMLAWNPDLDSDLETLEENMESTFDDWPEAATWQANGSFEMTTEEMARELLELEGVEI